MKNIVKKKIMRLLIIFLHFFKTFNLNDNNNNCIVCMCEIEENEECKKLKCGHMFHSNCIDNWLKRTLECPMCRNIIT